MPDSKITALASIGTGTDPVNDALVIVDVSDVSPGGMSATGTTKRVSLNNLLASSPTATLASATITGALTVDTTTLVVNPAGYPDRVGIGTATPSNSLDVIGTGAQTVRVGSSNGDLAILSMFSNGNATWSLASDSVYRVRKDSTEHHRIDATGIATWSNVGGVGGTAMTLNATGLGVGASPSYQLHVSKAQSSQTAIYVDNQQNNAAASSALTLSSYGGFWNLSVPHSSTFVNPLIFKFGSTEMMRLDASGNLLVGTTVISPSINGSGAITAKGVAGITLQTVSALATDYTLPIGAFAGILTIRSNGGGGSAVWMLDPNAGAVQISNNIVGRTITFTFSGGSWKLQQTVGTVPSTYNYLVLATQ